MTIKTARKVSEDPKQETLRKHKDTWNKEVSIFIAKLIAFKKGMNGKGDIRAGLSPSNIKDPIPDNVVQYLYDLSEDFSNIISGTKNIVNEQKAYSRGRRRGRKEQQHVIISNVDEFIIKKEASTWLSRLWSYVKHYPKFWNKLLKLRMDTLWNTPKLVSGLKEVQYYLVSSDENSIPRAAYSLLRLIPVIEDISNDCLEQGRMFKSVVSPEKTDGVKPEDQHKEEELFDMSGDKPEPKLKYDFIKYIKEENTVAGIAIDSAAVVNLLNENEISEINKIRGKIETISLKLLRYQIDDSELQDEEKLNGALELEKELADYYDNLLSTLNSVFKTDSNTIEGIVDFVKQSFENISDKTLNKVANKFIKKIINKWKMGLLTTPINQFRLDVYNDVDKSLEYIEKLQDLLEDEDRPIEEVLEQLSKVFLFLSKVASDIVKLANHHNTIHAEEALASSKPKTREVKKEERNKVYMLSSNLSLLGKLFIDLVEDIKKKKPIELEKNQEQDQNKEKESE